MPGSNLTIFRKGLLLVGVLLVFQLLLLVFLLRLQTEANNADRWAIHTKDVMAQTEEAYRLITEDVSQIRGVVVTGNPDFAPQLSYAADRVMAAFDRLENSVSDNPVELARVRSFRSDAAALLQWIADERELVSAGKSHEAVQGVLDLGRRGAIEKLHDHLQAILREEQRLDRERMDQVAAARRQGYWFIGVAAVITVGLAGLALWLFTRGVASRLATLAENAARLAERKPLAATVGGQDEIGRVDRAFRGAAIRLAEADIAEQRHRAELERRAAELSVANSDLAKANEDLRYKTQENETFVYSVSHDLRSPLVNLQGFSRELAQACKELRSAADEPGIPEQKRRQMLDLIDGDMLESVRFIQTAVSRSGNIIDALLRLSRAGRVEYKRQEVDVRSIVDRVVDAMQVTVRQKNAQVIVNDLPEADSDPTAVEQIFANLLGNAVNYLDHNRPGMIEVGAVAMPDGDGRTVRYYVRDNGLGIPAAYLSKMFVAFQRLHGTVAPGEGVGLALVRRITERLGGTISVDSTENVGTTFYVTLPAARRDAACPAPMTPAGAAV